MATKFIQQGKTYVCTETHRYGGEVWVKGEKYYSPEDYSLVNLGCSYFCPNYSRERHNDLFEEVVTPIKVYGKEQN